MIEVFIARLIFLIKAESQFQLSIFFFLHEPEKKKILSWNWLSALIKKISLAMKTSIIVQLSKSMKE